MTPIKKLVLSKETLRDLNVRTGVKTGTGTVGAACAPPGTNTQGVNCASVLCTGTCSAGCPGGSGHSGTSRVLPI
jgi:hypothetical protein